MAEIINTASEADLLATDEMIRNMRAGRFRNIAVGMGAAGALLMIGASSMIWASRQGNDPEALKAALANMPPLSVTVKLDPESKVGLAEGGKVQLDDGGTVALEPGAQVTVKGTIKTEAPVALPKTGSDADPAIQTTVTVFKTTKYGTGKIVTGWQYANGAAKTPFTQYCYYSELGVVAETERSENVGRNGKMFDAPAGVTDQSQRFSLCQWWNGGA